VTTGYAVVIAGSGGSYSAYVPELPGCVASGESVDAVEWLIRDAIRLHVNTLKYHRRPAPAPTTTAVRVVELA
jgi:predicted RNase H-like HicB family nuclease